MNKADGAIKVLDASKAGSLGRGKIMKGGCVRLAPGAEIGKHTTGSGEEFILVLEGVATLTCGTERVTLEAHQCAFIQQGTEHNVMNGPEADRELVYVYFVGGK